MSFVHLHTHSHYSIGRAVPRVRQLVERAAELGMPAIALTDNNSIAGLHALALAAGEAGIKPILGCELDILPSDHGLYQGRTHRLVLLVENDEGYRNLVRLVSRAHNQKSPDVPPHVSFADFERHCQGLIVLTGSRRSELYYWLREKKSTDTKNYMTRLASAVGQNNLFFEILEYPHPRTRRIMDQILEISRFLDIPAVATQNVHFMDPEDMPAYCALVQLPRTLSPYWPPPDTEMPTRHFTTAEEMKKRFGFTPELLEQTMEIANRCAFRFPRRRERLPLVDFDRGQDAATVLWDRAVRGAAARYGGLNEAVKDRLNEEYSDLCGAGGQAIELAGYMLLLHEVAGALRNQGLCRGVGRGNLLTSVVAYALGIIEIDPLAYGLHYQSPRQEPNCYPLFEIDVSTASMEQTLIFFREQYGEKNIASLGRRVDWARQPLFHHLSRWAGLPAVGLRQFSSVVRAKKTTSKTSAKRIAESDGEHHEPHRFQDGHSPTGDGRDFPMGWDEDVETSSDEPPDRSAWIEDTRIPRQQSLSDHETLAQVTHALHPCPRGFEAERAHYVLSKEPIDTIVPLVATPSGQTICQAEPGLLDRLLMPRVRFTSFPILNILERAVECVRHEAEGNFSLTDIPFDDEATFRLLGMGVTNGIASLHGITAKSILRSQAPQTILDLLRVHALAGKRRRGSALESPAGKGENQPALDTLEAVRNLPDCIQGYWCAYLKAHYPVSFMVAMLTHSLSSRGRMTPRQRPRFQILLREARKMRIEILEPDINFSNYEFSQEHHKIRTGLMVVLGMGERTYREIEKVRHGQGFSSLADFCQRTDPKHVPHTVVVNLIKAGAFQGLEPNRAKLLVEFEKALKNARLQSSRMAGASSTSRDGRGEYGSSSSQRTEGQLQLFEPWMFDEREGAPPAFEEEEDDFPYPTPREIMRYEQEAVGYTISYDLLDYYEELMHTMRAVSPFDLPRCSEGEIVYVAGFIDHTERDGPLVDDATEMLLDLEGFVVKIPVGASGNLSRLQSTRNPVLIEGEVRKHAKTERVLVAHNLYLLEEVAARGERVAELRLNLEGQNRKRLSAIRSILKSFKGHTAVTVENNERPSWFGGRGIENLNVFFCPPLYQGLKRILPETRITPLDPQGRTVEV